MSHHSAPDVSHPDDLAFLKAMRMATFGTNVVLPSGLELTPQQLHELTRD